MMITRLFAFLVAIFSIIPTHACTIFVLTDSQRTLFFNNEDYSNPTTRIWFLPADKGFYGVAYVGFDNDWAQGGVNTAGLAFDWVAGTKIDYVPDSKLLKVRGNNPSNRMLESCATVEEAIAFYQKYREEGFCYARIMIADKTGASVIIGVRDGKLFFDKSKKSRGFGYGEKALGEHLAKVPAASLQGGLPILQACKQEGQYPTQYSSIYDLRSGDIYLVSLKNAEKQVKLNLDSELAKEGHYYDIPALAKVGTGAPLPLSRGMHRFLADGYPAIPDSEPTTTQRFKAMFEGHYTGNVKEEEFSPELWQLAAPRLKEIEEEFKKWGKIQSFTLVERKEVDKQKHYRYLVEYEYVTILHLFVLNEQNKLMQGKGELWEWK
jgi:hypothetical protein